MTFDQHTYAMLSRNVRIAQEACDRIHPDFAHFPSVTVALAPQHIRQAYDLARGQLKLFEQEVASQGHGSFGIQGFQAPRQ